MLLLPFCRLGWCASARSFEPRWQTGLIEACSVTQATLALFERPVGRSMLARVSSSGRSRRRLLGGLAVAGLSLLSAGCDRKLGIVPTPLTGTAPRRVDPTPLEPSGPPTDPGVPVGAVFGRVVTLEGVTIDQDTVKAGDYVRLWLHWQLTADAQEDLRSIGRVVTSGGRVLASEDDQIGGRRKHLTRWQIGDRAVDEMRVRVTANASPGEYGLAVGVLRPDNQTAVPVTSRQPSADWQEDAVLVGTIVILAG